MSSARPTIQAGSNFSAASFASPGQFLQPPAVTKKHPVTDRYPYACWPPVFRLFSAFGMGKIARDQLKVRSFYFAFEFGRVKASWVGSAMSFKELIDLDNLVDFYDGF